MEPVDSSEVAARKASERARNWALVAIVFAVTSTFFTFAGIALFLLKGAH